MLVILPIYFVMKGDDTGTRLRTFIIRSIALIIANMGCLYILFAPKIYHIYAGTKVRSDVTTAVRTSTAGRTWSSKRSAVTSEVRSSITSGVTSNPGRNSTSEARNSLLSKQTTNKTRKVSEESL